MRKRVLFFATGLGIGGVASALMALIRFLEKQGYECKIMLPYFEMQSLELAMIPDGYFIGAAWDRPIKNKFLKNVVKLFNILTGWRFAFVNARRYEHDLFVVYQLLGNSHWVYYSKKPTIGWLHGEIQLNRSGLIAKISKMSIRKNLNKFFQIVGVSEQTCKRLQGLFNLAQEPINILNLFDVDSQILKGMELQSEIIESDVPNLLFLGRLFVEKGILRLLRVVKLLHQNGARFKLWIIGIGRVEKDARAFVKDNKLEEKVFFLGMKLSPQPYFKACDLLVNPSYTEGYPTTFREALVQDCAVLATDVGGSRQALADGIWGKLVENDDEALYNGILSYLENPLSVVPFVGFSRVRDEIRTSNGREEAKIIELVRKALGGSL